MLKKETNFDNLFGTSEEDNLEKLKKDIKTSFRFWAEDYFKNSSMSSLGVSLIEIYIDEMITIEVTLSRPGILIGKGGATINEAEITIRNQFSKECKIKLIEFDPWR